VPTLFFCFPYRQDPTSGLPIGLDELNRLSALSQEDRHRYALFLCTLSAGVSGHDFDRLQYCTLHLVDHSF
jgi:hypothetical protein